MRFTGFERDPQRLVRAEQMGLPDHFVDMAGPQPFGERNVGTGFFEHDVSGMIPASPRTLRTKREHAADSRMSQASTSDVRATSCIMTVPTSESWTPVEESRAQASGGMWVTRCVRVRPGIARGKTKQAIDFNDADKGTDAS